MAGWPYILCLVIGSVQRASSLKTPPVLSRGPLLLISCLRSLLDLPINGQNSGMSLGASWRRVMLGRRVTDGTERAKHIRERAREGDGRQTKGAYTKTQTEESKANLKLKSNEVLIHWGEGGWVSEIQSLWSESPHARRWFRRGYFSFSVKCKQVWLTVLIRSK